jgi:hypothetical protein
VRDYTRAAPAGPGATGEPTSNAEDLKKRANRLAARYLAARAQPQEIRVKGFWRVELSGLVSEVRIEQAADAGSAATRP